MTRFSGQILFYGTNGVRMLQDLVNGDIDACFMQSGWIELNYPQVLPLVRPIAQTNYTYEGEPYPFPVTTPLVPQFGLAAAPHIPWLLRQRIFDALNRLNASLPAAAAAGVALFSLPGDYGAVRDLVLETGIMYQTAARVYSCHDAFSPLDDLVICPDGYVKRPGVAVEDTCDAALEECPAGLTCVCRPCIADQPVRMRPLRFGLRAAHAAAGLLATRSPGRRLFGQVAP